ncbi:MAG: hypothetical protein ABSC25_26355, partial [Roseiarcus sp.]
MTEKVLRLFVSSPGDVQSERDRVDFVVERLNAEFKGRARIEPIRWETSYYSAHETFQKQIPEAADCDLVIAVFRARLGTPLPDDFPRLPNGEPYPSGTAYEVLSAILARKTGKPLPDIFVFRFPNPPTVTLDSAERADVEAQWARLKAFFDAWFKTRDGQFVAAFQSYDSTDDFAAKIEDCLRQWLARQGFVAQGAVWDRLARGSPFPGLEAFQADRGAVFFGRDLAIRQSIERLREAGADDKRLPFLLVIGASGSGKSSLLRAGLMPRLTLPGAIPEVDLWRVAIVTPGRDPFGALAESLLGATALGPELKQGAFGDKSLLARQLAGDPAIALAPLREALDKAAETRRREANFETPRPARLALAIDQAERLFTEAEPGRAQAFAELLAALAREKLAYVIIVLRSDAYPRFQGVPALLDLRDKGASFDLIPPSAAELEEIVKRPAEACEPPLVFETRDGRSLAARLVAEAKGGDALPLLQAALARLYSEQEKRGDGVLRFSDYRGMDAAVSETADEAMASLDGAARGELPSLVAGLVSDVAADPLTGAPTPHVVALDRQAFEAGRPARKALIDAFVDKRLLTAEGDAGATRVRPVHEALLRIWPEAATIVAETASLIRVRHALEPIVREWSAGGAPDKPGYLELSPPLLAGAEQALARFGDDLPAPMREFIAEAIKLDAARRERERAEQERKVRDAQALAAARSRVAWVAGAGLVVALGLAGLAAWQWRDATAERDRAENTLTLATQTANGLVFDLALKFRDVVGVRAATIKDILDRARALQDQLLGAGESSPDLRRSQAAALGETSDTLLTLGDTKGALAAATHAQEIFQELLTQQPDSTDFQRDLSVSDEKVGDVQVAQGDLAGALKSYQASLAIGDRLAQSDPGNAGWQRDLSVSDEKVGDVQVAEGDLAGALKSYQARLAIADRLAKSDPGNAGWQRDLSVSDDRVGNVQVAEGDLAGALKSYQAELAAELAIMDRLAKSDPGNAGWQRDLAASDIKVGDVQVAQGDLAGALKSYQASLAIMDRLARSDPGNAGWQRDLSVSNNRVGDVQVAQGDLAGALKSYQASLAIRDRLAQSDPGNAGWQRDLLVSDDRVGNVKVAQGDLAGALKSYQAGLAIADRLSKSDPGNAGWQRDLSVSDEKVGDVQVAEGDLAGALKSYQAELAIMDRLAKSDPGNAGWQRDLAA